MNNFHFINRALNNTHLLGSLRISFALSRMKDSTSEGSLLIARRDYVSPLETPIWHFIESAEKNSPKSFSSFHKREFLVSESISEYIKAQIKSQYNKLSNTIILIPQLLVHP